MKKKLTCVLCALAIVVSSNTLVFATIGGGGMMRPVSQPIEIACLEANPGE